jgi:cysteine synthase
MDLLRAIGNTSIVQLRRVVPAGCAAIHAKLEWENPTGSLKDRMAHAVISRAEENGRLKPGDTVVEYTGGSTGTSLALVCAAKGYRLPVVTSDAFVHCAGTAASLLERLQARTSLRQFRSRSGSGPARRSSRSWPTQD